MESGNRLPELLAALDVEDRLAASEPASSRARSAEASPKGTMGLTMLRKRRGTLLSRQSTNTEGGTGGGRSGKLAVSELLRSARQRLAEEREAYRTGTRAGRFSALCEEKVRASSRFSLVRVLCHTRVLTHCVKMRVVVVFACSVRTEMKRRVCVVVVVCMDAFRAAS